MCHDNKRARIDASGDDACPYDNLSRNELLELLIQRDTQISILQRPAKFVNSTKVEPNANDFSWEPTVDLEKMVRTFAANLPGDAPERERQNLNTSFLKLTPSQKSIFFYLCEKLDGTVDSIPPNHTLYGLNVANWIKIILHLSSQMSGIFGKDCIGANDQKEGRPFIMFEDQFGDWNTMKSARLIAFIIYGAAALEWRDASHLCGNKLCLNPSHIWPESHAANKDRDICHKAGFTASESCPHKPACLPSLKFDSEVSIEDPDPARLFAFEEIPINESNKVTNIHKGFNIQVEDHEYVRRGKWGYYSCVNWRNSFKCDGYLNLKGNIARSYQ